MDNNAFKDLVRSYGDKNSSSKNGSSSSKAIARKAVEEEFRKRKRKHTRGGDLSSSDEDEDHRPSHKKGKSQQEYESHEKDGDDAQAIQKDLSSRYRDRAKERREGKLGEDAAVTDNVASDNLLIVPHNKKGLDLSLIRKERLDHHTKSGRGNSKLVTAVTTKTGHSNEQEITSKIDSVDEVRDQLPTIDEANQILEDFVLCSDHENTNDDKNGNIPTNHLNNNLVKYLKELVSWNTLDVSSWEGESANAGHSLQQTRFSFAIDGNPSDPTRAWEIPRQYTMSRNFSGGSVSLFTNVMMNKINLVFQNQNLIRKKMMERETTTTTSSRGIDRKEGSTSIMNDNNCGAEDESDDDDMFGGLDN